LREEPDAYGLIARSEGYYEDEQKIGPDLVGCHCSWDYRRNVIPMVE
jgi:hypothetical protein